MGNQEIRTSEVLVSVLPLTRSVSFDKSCYLSETWFLQL